MKRRHLLVTAAAALPLMQVPQALAQSDKPIKLLVGFPPGGSIDTVARTIAEKMRAELNQPVVIENKVGAGGRLAAELLKNAPADGTTLMITPVVVPVLAPLVFSKLPYNPATDFTPVGHVVNFNFGLAVKADSPIKNVQEFVAWIKANPGRIRSVHLKDWTPGPKTEEKGYRVLFGEGVTPWKELITAAESVGGVELYLLEQEGSRFSQMETARRCLENFKGLRG